MLSKIIDILTECNEQMIVQVDDRTYVELQAYATKLEKARISKQEPFTHSAITQELARLSLAPWLGRLRLCSNRR